MRAEDVPFKEPLDRKIERWNQATRQLAEEVLRSEPGPEASKEKATRVAMVLEQARLLVEWVTEGRLTRVTLG